MNRALSTALDVALCLLLISAAVIPLQAMSPTPESAPSPATPTLSILATTSGVPNHTASTPLETLAAAAIADAAGHQGAANSLRRSAETVLSQLSQPTQVTVRWVPLEEFKLSGRVVVGKTPPPTAAIDARRLIVPLAATRPGRQSAANFSVLASTAATAIRSRLTDISPAATSAATPASGDRKERLYRVLNASVETVPAARDLLAIDTVIVVVRTWNR